MIKNILRWLVRRDADASDSRMSAWIQTMQIFVPTVIGIREGLLAGFSVFGALYVARVIAGYADLNHLHVTKYKNNYISIKAPLNAKILEDDEEKVRRAFASGLV